MILLSAVFVWLRGSCSWP